MKHLGDITKIKGDKVPVVDVITGGSPCQDLSVAGKRAGLDGERSGLFMEQIRIIKEMRNENIRQLSMRGTAYTWRDIRPRFMVWENVQGAFSSNKGQDFKAVLEETAKIVEPNAVIPEPEGGKWPYAGCIVGDGWSIAWRLHDAQFWGVPQRRKRICLLADFASDNAGRILFELQRKANENDREETVMDIGEEPESKIQSVSESVPGNTEASGKEGKEVAGDIGAGIEETGRCLAGVERDVVCPVAYRKQAHPQTAEEGQGWENTDINDTLNVYDNSEARTPTLVVENHPNDSRVKIAQDGVVQTLSSRMGTGGGNVPMVMESYPEKTGSLCASGYDKLGTQEVANDMYVVQSSWNGGQISPTLTANNANGAQRMPDKENFNAVISFTTEMTPKIDENEVGFSLRSRDYKDPQSVAYGLDRAAYNQGINAQYDFAVEKEKIGTQVAKGPGAVCQSVVRRLTPMERERLQGFPDGWTDIGDWVDSNGKNHKGESDSPRYKALGNSIALPFWMWLAERICKEPGIKTMASLFDGIGGFPLSFQKYGCTPIWASEIEEFPIAVTKIHFPD